MRRPAVLLGLLLISAPLLAAEPLDQNGKPQPWKGSTEGYTLIDFAASWCRPCWSVLPRLQEFADEHPKVRVIVVAVDDSVSGRDALVDELDLTVPVVWDEHHSIAGHYRPRGMPATFVIDAKGRVVYSHVGSSDDDWQKLVKFFD